MSLDLAGTSARENEVAELVKQVNLETFRVRNCEGVTAAVLRTLADTAKSLKLLDISGNDNLPASAFQDVCRIVTLTTLHLGGDGVTDRSLARIGDLQQLEILKAFCPRITDVTGVEIGKLRKLQRLSLAGCRKLTKKTVFALKALPDLEVLVVLGCREGFQAAAKQLAADCHLI